MNTYTRILVVALLMALAASSTAARIVIPRDTVIPVTLDKAIGSQSGQAGDVFYVHQSGVNGEGFPERTQFTGNVVSVTKASGRTAGQLGVSFVSAELPNGLRVPIAGRLTSLDAASTQTNPTTGRLMGTTTGDNQDLKFIAIGGGAGALIGQLTKKRPLVGGLIGAAAGYIYSRTQTKAAIGKDVHIDAGTRFGILLTQDVTLTEPKSVAPAALAAAGPYTGPGWQVSFNNLQPVMSGNDLMVPFRAVMDSIEMPFDYNSATKTIRTGRSDSLHEMYTAVGTNLVYVDGVPTRLDTASRFINGAAYVPASYIELLTQRTAYWNQKSGILRIE